MALARLTTWAAGQVLTASALNAEFDNILTNPLSLISTASVASKGLLLVGNATALVGLAVGSDNQVLTADSTQAAGVKWAAVSAGGSPGFNTITNGTNTTAAMVIGSGASLVPTGTGILRATDLQFGSDAQGDVPVRGASTYGRVACGASGNLLTSNGTTWVSQAAVSGGGTIHDYAGTISSNVPGSYFVSFYSPSGGSTTTETPYYTSSNPPTQTVATRSGTVKNLYVYLKSVLSGGTTHTYTMRKNGVDQSITFTIPNGSQSGSDTVNSFSVAAGDLISLKCVIGTANSGSFDFQRFLFEIA